MTFDSRWKNPQGKDPEALWRWAQELIAELRKGDFADAAFEDNVGTGLTNAQLADMAAWTVKMRNASTSGDPEDVNRAALTAGSAPLIAHELFGFLSSNELRRFATGNVGGLQLLNSGVVDDDATLDIVLTSFTSYRALKFLLQSFVPATDDVELWLRFSTDGGSSYDATGYSYALATVADNSGTVTGIVSAAANQILIAGHTSATAAISNVANEGGVDAEITIHDQTAARYSRARISSGYQSAAAVQIAQHGSGQRENAQDTNAVRFLFESGNITSGGWALYGLA